MTVLRFTGPLRNSCDRMNFIKHFTCELHLVGAGLVPLVGCECVMMAIRVVFQK